MCYTILHGQNFGFYGHQTNNYTSPYICFFTNMYFPFASLQIAYIRPDIQSI